MYEWQRTGHFKPLTLNAVLTIYAPLILNVREIFFSGTNHLMGYFAGYFEGAETFLTPKLFWAIKFWKAVNG
jgi:hypothetical protein